MTVPGFFSKWQNRVLQESTLNKSNDYYNLSEHAKYGVLGFFSLLVLLTSFLFNSPREIVNGLWQIITAPSILITDYMAIANPGAAFFNAGLLMLFCLAIAASVKLDINGPIIAAVFTVGGFALFGKTIFNVWPIIGGVFLYARFQKDHFSRFLLPALFGTALGPLVSQIAFGFNLPLAVAIPGGIFAGLIAGFILPAMANHFVVFHQGYNLYNIGFTCGIAGLMIMALFRSFGFETQDTLVVSDRYNRDLSIALAVYFLLMLLLGLFLTRSWLASLHHLFKQPGRLVSDFVASEGLGPSLINMSLLGFLTTGYVLAVSGDINGPTIGGIFTVVGFGAFGKHVRNVIPILAGVYLASLLNIWEPNSSAALLAALFGTTLAPIAGTYGWPYGVIAGFIHMAVVMNVSDLHGGMNLYNNGFAGGFVAAILVPIFDAIRNRLISQKELKERQET